MITIMVTTATVIPMLMTTSTERGASDAPAADDTASLFRLMTWLSPSFSVGAFSYSSGIEWAVEAGDIADAATLRDWLAALLRDGAGFCDGVLLCHAHRAGAWASMKSGHVVILRGSQGLAPQDDGFGTASR